MTRLYAYRMPTRWVRAVGHQLTPAATPLDLAACNPAGSADTAWTGLASLDIPTRSRPGRFVAHRRGCYFAVPCSGVS